MINFIRKHINSALWAVVILILCGAPSSGFSGFRFINIPQFDKVVHLGLYVVFTLLIISENNPNRNMGTVDRRYKIIALAVASAYGLLIELLQWLIFTSRSADFFDFLADVAGSVLAIFAYKLVNKYSKGII
ncbi:MAG: VanZ family protein [Bacteroidales bacterium]